jgi:hypothetical protein
MTRSSVTTSAGPISSARRTASPCTKVMRSARPASSAACLATDRRGRGIRERRRWRRRGAPRRYPDAATDVQDGRPHACSRMRSRRPESSDPDHRVDTDAGRHRHSVVEDRGELISRRRPSSGRYPGRSQGAGPSVAGVAQRRLSARHQRRHANRFRRPQTSRPPRGSGRRPVTVHVLSACVISPPSPPPGGSKSGSKMGS